MKVTANPHNKETVFVAPVVLNPWKRMREAVAVAVEKPTKYIGFTLHVRSTSQEMWRLQETHTFVEKMSSALLK